MLGYSGSASLETPHHPLNKPWLATWRMSDHMKRGPAVRLRPRDGSEVILDRAAQAISS